MCILICFGAITTCTKKIKVPENSPIAEKKSEVLKKFGDERIDPYFWLRERENLKVLEHLKQENIYAQKALKPIEGLRKRLFKEMKGREKKEDQSVPVQIDNYFYYVRYEEKSEYPIVARKKENLKTKEEIILDANLLAKDQAFFQLGHYEVSPDHQVLAYATDLIGRRIYTIYFKDLNTGKLLDQKIENVTANFAWAEDRKTLLFTEQNKKTLRHEKVYRFNFRTGEKHLVYHEKDEKYYAGISKTKSKKYLLIEIGSKESSEMRYMPANAPEKKPKLFQRRQAKHEYDVFHAGDHFVIHSNLKAKNFKLFRTPDEQKTNIASWKTLIEHRPDVLLSSLSVFEKYMSLSIRTQGIKEIELYDRVTKKRWIMEQPEKSHVVYIESNPNYQSHQLRYVYASMTTPTTIVDYDVFKKTKEVKKVKEILGGFEAKNYGSRRIVAKAKDGTEIPISLMYRKDAQHKKPKPLLLYGYGSYGASMEPWFSSTRLSLVDRGFIFAIAHIRGGSEMGRHWYENGKFLKKRNTFTDFIACAEFLIEEKYTSPKHLYAMGGSAGGLLMGAIINMQPDLFQGVVTQVPFVDVLTTMLDDTIPLTTFEYEEWGNPNQKAYYDYIKSYSPYDNVKTQAYPHLLVSTGLHDSQVQYWEPAKWVAKLRATKTDNHLLVFDINLDAGHGGKSGRFKSLEDTARDYAFLLYLEEIRR